MFAPDPGDVDGSIRKLWNRTGASAKPRSVFQPTLATKNEGHIFPQSCNDLILSASLFTLF